MPSGRIHNAVTFALTGSALAVAAAFPAQRAEILAVCAGMSAGLFLSPDLDLADGSIALSNVRKAPSMVSKALLVGRAPTIRKFAQAVGWLLAWAWSIIWWPYGVIVKHRSWVSHAPILSTALRVGYLSVLVVPACAASYRLTDVGWKYAALAFAGLCVVDVAHWGMDMAQSNIKTWKRKLMRSR